MVPSAQNISYCCKQYKPTEVFIYSDRYSCEIFNIQAFLQTFKKTSDIKFQENPPCGSRHDTNGQATACPFVSCRGWGDRHDGNRRLSPPLQRPSLIGKREELDHLVSNHYRLEEEKLELFCFNIFLSLSQQRSEMQA